MFNTGLFTKYYEPIYAYQTGSDISFLTDYELGNKGITERPEKANYFSQPELLLFDWHYPINVHYPHILEDSENQKRIPKNILRSKNLTEIKSIFKISGVVLYVLSSILGQHYFILRIFKNKREINIFTPFGGFGFFDETVDLIE